MKILALDIASRTTGWAVIKNGRVIRKDMGLIQIDPKNSMGERLYQFEVEVKNLISQQKPDIIGVEDIFRGRNALTFKTLSLFRGVALKTIWESAAQDPISIMAAKVRELIDLPNNKEKVFASLNKKYRLGFKFESGNDIVDAIALGLACHNVIKNGIDLTATKKRRRKRKKKVKK